MFDDGVKPATGRNARAGRPVVANVNSTLRLSILDRSALRGDEDVPTAIRATIDMAGHAERLGFHRFWVAEHHSVPGIGGSAPTVLAGAVAAATTSIRVGTGGVMLPNHNPLVVAEQVGTLEAVHPGRIDLGLGRSMGFTPAVRAALGTPETSGDRGATESDDFVDRLRLLLGYLTGEQDTHPGVHARPGEGARPEPFLLATGAGADIAAKLGLPLVIAVVRGTEQATATVARYRQRFTPSRWAARPYVTVAQPVAIADTDAAARDVAISEAWSTVLSRTTGQFNPLQAPDRVRATAKTVRQNKLLDETLAGTAYGTPENVRSQIAPLLDATMADELLVTTAGYDRAVQVESWQRLVRSRSRLRSR